MITRHSTGPTAIVTLLLAIAVVAAGCVSSRTGGAAGPLVSSEPANIPAAQSLAPSADPDTATATPAPTASAPPPTTTKTAWGRIWDALPETFPAYPGAEPADAGEGPTSAVVAAPAKVARVVDWYRGALVAAGYSIEALGGPMEDGSTVIDAVGLEPTCRIQVSIGPRGTQTTVSILFAAACPFR